MSGIPPCVPGFGKFHGDSPRLRTLPIWWFSVPARDFKPEDVQRYLERIVEVRGVAMDSLDQYRARIFELVDSKSPEVLKAWLERQVYIALGFMMSCAADLRVDTCALEGMDPAAYDRILHLENSPYYTLCALALGYRNEEEDKYARLAKVRFDRDEVIPVI